MLPILILCYARLDTLTQTLESVLAQPHGPIYVSCDGPKEGDEESNKELHSYIKSLLKKEIIVDFVIHARNFGTLVGVSKGVSWFFERVEVGIILEDDLVLEIDLLESIECTKQFLDFPEVLSIGLFNYIPHTSIDSDSSLVRCSKFVVSWGWVTTKENWNLRSTTFQGVNYMDLFTKMKESIGLSSALWHLYQFYKEYQMEKRDIKRCDWDFLWQLNSFEKEKVNITYNRNLIRNIGNGAGATHTLNKDLDYPIDKISKGELSEVSKNLAVPSVDKAADKYFCKTRKIGKALRADIRLRTRLKKALNKS